MTYATPQLGFRSYGEGEKIDHRRRKRNRIRASCLNCYASKRKCDKKRPCTRCVRLGNTSLCVYETDEPLHTGHGHNFDEVRQLRRRIAELEGVIYQFKKKPHSKWLTKAETNLDKSTHPRLWAQGNAADTNGTLGIMSAAPTKLESVDPSLRHALLDHKPIYNSGQYAHSSEEMEVINHPTTTYSSSSCSSCGDTSPYQPLPNEKHTMHMATSVRSSKNTEDEVSPDRDTFSTLSCYSSDTSPHTYTLPMEHNSPTFLYPSPSPHITDTTCHCLRNPSAFGPLVNLSVSLRSAREALEVLHCSEYHCGLFSYISFLENHIFLMSPQERQPNSTPETTSFSRAHMPYVDNMSTELSNSSG